MQTMNMMNTFLQNYLSTKRLTDLKLEDVKDPTPVTQQAPKGSIMGGSEQQYFSSLISPPPHDMVTKHAKNNSEMIAKMVNSGENRADINGISPLLNNIFGAFSLKNLNQKIAAKNVVEEKQQPGLSFPPLIALPG